MKSIEPPAEIKYNIFGAYLTLQEFQEVVLQEMLSELALREISDDVHKLEEIRIRTHHRKLVSMMPREWWVGKMKDLLAEWKELFGL